MLYDQAKGRYQVWNYTITISKLWQSFVIRSSLGDQETIVYIRKSRSI